MGRTTRRGAIVAIAAASMLLTGCGYKSADSGQVGVIQNGSINPGANRDLIGCIQPETTQNQFLDDVFYYPARQISYDASGDAGAERTAYVVTSSAEAPTELAIPVTITFDLTTDCDLLKDFHRNQGTKYSAWMKDGKTDAGWIELLSYAVGQPTNATLVSMAVRRPWQEIVFDDEARVEFQRELNETLPKAIAQRTGGEYFVNIQATVLKPRPLDQGLLDAIAEEQKSVALANSKREAAEAQITVAEAETRVAQEQARKRQAEIEGFPSVEDFLKSQMIEKGLNPYQPQLVPLPASGN